jgi:histone H3/H4
VNQIVEEEGQALNTSATPQFTSALADMVYAQAGPSVSALIIETLAVDLESFAGHAKRSIINVEDVKVVFAMG